MGKISYGDMTLNTGAQVARQAILVGGAFFALTRFPANTKLVTAAALGTFGAVGFGRGGAVGFGRGLYDTAEEKVNIVRGGLFAVFDLVTHGLDLLCVYQVAKLVGNRSGASLLRQSLVFGGSAIWGVYRGAGQVVNTKKIDSVYADAPGVLAPLLPCF